MRRAAELEVVQEAAVLVQEPAVQAQAAPVPALVGAQGRVPEVEATLTRNEAVREPRAHAA